MGYSRQEHWSGLPCRLPGDFPDPGIEPLSLMSPALAGGFFTTSATWRSPMGKVRRYKRRNQVKEITDLERDQGNLQIFKKVLSCLIFSGMNA